MTAMIDIVDTQEAFKKTGAELFKELYRIYPVADAGTTARTVSGAMMC